MYGHEQKGNKKSNGFLTKFSIIFVVDRELFLALSALPCRVSIWSGLDTSLGSLSTLVKSLKISGNIKPSPPLWVISNLCEVGK